MMMKHSPLKRITFGFPKRSSFSSSSSSSSSTTIRSSFPASSSTSSRRATTLSAYAHQSHLVATVFGCTGFIGAYIVSRLLKIGAQVVIPYRGEEKEFNHLKPESEVGQLVPIPWSLRNYTSIQDAVSKSDQ